MNVLSFFPVWWPSEVFIGEYTIYTPGNLYFHCQALIMMWTYTLYSLASQSEWPSTTSAAAPGLKERVQDVERAPFSNALDIIYILFVFLRMLLPMQFICLSNSTLGFGRVAGRSKEIWFTTSQPCVPVPAGAQAVVSLGTWCHCPIHTPRNPILLVLFGTCAGTLKLCIYVYILCICIKFTLDARKV